jgi:hypothetical protein
VTVHGGLRLALDVAILELKPIFEQALAWFIDFERRYRPDQPRVPAGNPHGGQWTDAGGASRSRNSSGTKKPIKTALAGVLVLQKVGVGQAGMMRMCTYEDMFGRQFSREQSASEFCPRTLAVPPYHGPY